MIKQGISGTTLYGDADWTVICDFDGTISFDDVTDTLMENFGLPGWQLLEQRWEQGEIGSRECLSGQIALLDISLEQLNHCLDAMTIDTEFAHFAHWAQMQHIPLYVVSDGLDYAIERILQRHHINGLSVMANRLQQIGERSWSVDFPNNDNACLKASGTCKCQVARRLTQHKFLLVGDGRSDFCIAATADHVLAKKSLLAECQRSGIAHTSFVDFSQARDCLEWLLTQDTCHPHRMHYDYTT